MPSDRTLYVGFLGLCTAAAVCGLVAIGLLAGWL